jgi:glycosyltransferase involved in cell wall biosynthesis
MDKPLVSIITASFNSAQTIRDALQSVANQTYPNIEHMVVDGISTDGTLEIVKEFPKITLISEKDRGVYDAFNKGWKLAKGEIIAFLNADDFYENKTVVADIVEAMQTKPADSAWADLVYVNPKNSEKILRYWRSSEYRPGIFRHGWAPAHPTFFVRREVYEKFGGFDEQFKIAADYELMLRFLEVYKISGTYLPKVLVRMRHGGMSNRPLNILRANWEVYRAWQKNGLRGGSLAVLRKVFSKLFQF